MALNRPKNKKKKKIHIKSTDKSAGQNPYNTQNKALKNKNTITNIHSLNIKSMINKIATKTIK